ncbi:ABC transporter ATP-binding protein [Protaetiibacter intestinalis]|uniref:ABC transporter ATP-binding protein n=1 Tax=Protaetiibacter intestinalis TaxID=2419774 RepID=A0A387BEC5_9MICO|nr:ABC transporter ATP-binding protein [Protaetiibacter intestinalis]AYF99406.1 ABC transporter ATP-binding protein [Protaetiibacter intestinalis]
MDTESALLVAEDIEKRYPVRGAAREAHVLRGISLQVRAGELVSIVGPSGSGKSTLLYCLAGLVPLSHGSVRIAGARFSELSVGRSSRFRRDHLGFVFQSYNLLPSLTALQNVQLPARLARRRFEPRASWEALDAVGLADHAQALPGTLSGGQQQRVAIARALFSKPELLFADEPTGALDARATRLVLDQLRLTAVDGRAVLMVTHDLEAAASADRVLVLRNGLLHRELVAPTTREVFDAVELAA